MPKASPAHTAARREEIMDACQRLYSAMPFKDVTIKRIGSVTSMTRTSIYTYFQTREEIFLALFQREYTRWTQDLEDVGTRQPTLDRASLAQALADTLARREVMLRLLSTNLRDMEEHSRLERLVDFKRTYKRTMETVTDLTRQACPELTEPQVQGLTLALFLQIHGIYSYAFHSPKQRQAMLAAGISPVDQSLHSLALSGFRKLLGVDDTTPRAAQR